MQAELRELIRDARQATGSAWLAREAIALLDLTSLNDDDNEDSIAGLLNKARTPYGDVAAVCVFPQFIRQARDTLAGTNVKIATVCNFPHGGDDVGKAVAEAAHAVDVGAEEIDVVLPYSTYAGGDTQKALEVVRGVRAASGGLTLKVILETAALNENQITMATRDCVAEGANFIKTSTGKYNGGATLDCAAIILKALADIAEETSAEAGFKASGGIAQLSDAAGYLFLAEQIMGDGWPNPSSFRFGASSLLDELIGEIDYIENKPPAGRTQTSF